MGNVIWKYSLGPTDAHTLSVPKGAEFIHADIQNGEFFVWAIIPDEIADHENRYILIAPTGGPGDDRLVARDHINTFLDKGYVWHVFEVKYD